MPPPHGRRTSGPAFRRTSRRLYSPTHPAINETPGVSPGLQLDFPETPTTVRVQDGQPLTTDGPFAEIRESIGGYFVCEAEDLEHAIEPAARVPAARLGGAVEVRPIVEW